MWAYSRPALIHPISIGTSFQIWTKKKKKKTPMKKLISGTSPRRNDAPKDEADRRVPPQLQIKRADWPETPSVEYNITEN